MTSLRHRYTAFRLLLWLGLVHTVCYYSFHHRRPPFLFSGRKSASTPWPSTKEAFVQAELENEIDGPHDLEPLKDLCKTKDFQPGLIIRCDPVDSDLGHVRSMVLGMVRFALEAGGTWPFFRLPQTGLI